MLAYLDFRYRLPRLVTFRTIDTVRPSQALDLHRARIRQIALSHHVRDVRVFGSALRRDDVEGSDLDLLVEPTAETTLFDIGAIN